MTRHVGHSYKIIMNIIINNLLLNIHDPVVLLVHEITMIRKRFSSCPPIVNIPNDSNENEVTGTILQELNKSYESMFNHSFTSSAVKYCGKKEGIEFRKSSTEKKKEEFSSVSFEIL